MSIFFAHRTHLDQRKCNPLPHIKDRFCVMKKLQTIKNRSDEFHGDDINS